MNGTIIRCLTSCLDQQIVRRFLSKNEVGEALVLGGMLSVETSLYGGIGMFPVERPQERGQREAFKNPFSSRHLSVFVPEST